MPCRTAPGWPSARPDGVTCVLDKQAGGYGCSGPIPAAPGGANLVTAAPSRAPGFASSAQPMYGIVDGAKPLPPNTRLSFQHRQLRHRRGRHELPEQRRPVGLRAQPRGQLHVRIEALLFTSATSKLGQC